jgi:hypothetical protein
MRSYGTSGLRPNASLAADGRRIRIGMLSDSAEKVEYEDAKRNQGEIRRRRVTQGRKRGVHVAVRHAGCLGQSQSTSKSDDQRLHNSILEECAKIKSLSDVPVSYKGRISVVKKLLTQQPQADDSINQQTPVRDGQPGKGSNHLRVSVIFPCGCCYDVPTWRSP